jgi:uncharacterized membrane protein
MPHECGDAEGQPERGGPRGGAFWGVTVGDSVRTASFRSSDDVHRGTFWEKEEKPMSELLVAVFDKELKAEEVRLDLMKMNHTHLVDVEEAVVAVRTATGKVRLHHAQHLTVPGALSGGFLGTLVGVMLFNPIFAFFGMVVGAVVGGSSGALVDIGIDDLFMEDLAQHLKPGTSALFILVKEADPEKVLEEVKKFDGKVFRTTLAHADQTRLQKALDESAREPRS